MSNIESLRQRPVTRHRRWLIAAFWLIGATAWDAGQGGASEARVVTWKTGTELERQLEQSIGITWSAVPLRQAVSTLARSQGVAVFLDRRIDPDQEVQFSVPDTPLRQVFQRLAEHLRLGTCRVGPVVYLGPPATTAVLRTAVMQTQEAAQSLPSATRSRVLRTQLLRWPEASSPRQLLEQLAADAELPLEGLEQIPHDLWPAADLPPLDVAQRFSLVLAGFGLTFAYTEMPAVRLLPLPSSAVVERSYSVSARQQAALQELAERFPTARVSRDAGKVLVEAPLEAHEFLQGLLRGQRTPGTTPTKPDPKAEVRWTLRIENKPLGAVVKTVATRLERQLEYDPALHGKLSQLVSFDVNNVTLDELLRTALTSAGLTYRLETATLRILPAD